MRMRFPNLWFSGDKIWRDFWYQVYNFLLPRCVIHQCFLCSVFTVSVDRFGATRNGGNVCNLTVVHDHGLTWIKALWSKTTRQKSALRIVPNTTRNKAFCHNRRKANEQDIFGFSKYADLAFTSSGFKTGRSRWASLESMKRPKLIKRP